ncbi:MAG: hypothetical protein J3K34DRAFT_464902 [Monoraphidium minutum]|nr:MAG: hypothetical protein J3K34DRAFT_464902 [Monoraphidium minutum]
MPHPSGAVWACVATFAAVALPIGAATGVLKLKLETRPTKWLEVFFVVFLSRGLLEELVFRAALLPHPAVDGPTPPLDFALRAAAGTAAFRLPARFLGMCAALGAACSAVYYATASLASIWLVHCVPVAVWLLLLGGAERVQ